MRKTLDGILGDVVLFSPLQGQETKVLSSCCGISECSIPLLRSCPRQKTQRAMPREMETQLSDTDNVLTVRTDCHMLGPKSSPQNPNSNLFPNISGFTVVVVISVVVVVVAVEVDVEVIVVVVVVIVVVVIVVVYNVYSI